MKKMDQWVKDHSINGPSPVEFTGMRKNEVQLFYDIDNDSWAIVDNLSMADFVRDLFGIYYVVFKDEYVQYLKKN